MSCIAINLSFHSQTFWNSFKHTCLLWSEQNQKERSVFLRDIICWWIQGSNRDGGRGWKVYSGNHFWPRNSLRSSLIILIFETLLESTSEKECLVMPCPYSCWISWMAAMQQPNYQPNWRKRAEMALWKIWAKKRERAILKTYPQ